MEKRRFTAQVVDDFARKWFEATAVDENISVDDAKKYYGDEEFYRFAERVSGKAVTITENTYFVGTTDYFEVIDNNFVMHEGLFEEIKGD